MNQTISPSTAVLIDYTNHRGERAGRVVVPKRIHFGPTPWHRGPQWLMEAVDVEEDATRDFAMASIHSWQPAPEAPTP